MGAGEQTLWAGHLAAALAAAGVQRAVISPGSRSAPLTLALAAEPGIETRLIVDERSAGFFALGQARLTGVPSVLVCTSGTAGAHYLPAVIEASRARLPLVVLTADRPPELHHRDAPQTIEQARLFGAHVRGFIELGAPEATPEALAALDHTIALAVGTCLAPEPGPVHLNLWLRKPLEPPESMPPPPPHPALPRHIHSGCEPGPAAVELAARACEEQQRGVILCGPESLHASPRAELIARLSRRTGMPVLAEAASQVRFSDFLLPATRVDGFEWLVRAGYFRGPREPDLVLHFGGPSAPSGAPPLASGIGGGHLVAIREWGWPDPASRVGTMIHADPNRLLEGLLRRLGDGSAEASRWDAELARADRLIWARLAEWIDDQPALSEAQAVRIAVGSLPGDTFLALGNSLAIREVDLFCPSSLARAAVLHQRGAYGIDGLISAAAGSATIARTPLTLILGDLSFLHDLGGLATAVDLAIPLVVVILQNDGGRLFELLPLGARGDLKETFERLFVAPQGTGLGRVAESFGHRYAAVSAPGELKTALRDAYREPGCTVIEAMVGPGAVEHQRELLRRLGPLLDTPA